VPNLVTRIVLFLSSYAPLFLILVIRDSFASRWVSVGFGVLAAGSLLGLFVYLRLALSLAPLPITVSSVTARDGDAMAYFVTYLLPFLDVSFEDRGNAVALGILLLVLGVVYVNTNLVHTNPILNLCGFHIFELEADDGKKLAFISRRAYIRTGATVRAVALGDYVVMEKPDEG
jgi:hypothetical protein